jgi:hypothetical protein
VIEVLRDLRALRQLELGRTRMSTAAAANERCRGTSVAVDGQTAWVVLVAGPDPEATPAAHSFAGLLQKPVRSRKPSMLVNRYRAVAAASSP